MDFWDRMSPNGGEELLTPRRAGIEQVSNRGELIIMIGTDVVQTMKSPDQQSWPVRLQGDGGNSDTASRESLEPANEHEPENVVYRVSMKSKKKIIIC